MISVHARTKEQAFKGKADWRIIKSLKDAVSIPVVGNGDVTNPESYFRMKEETGCDAVMIGRAAIGNPWVFDEVSAAIDGRAFEPPSARERVSAMLDHVRLAVGFYGEMIGMISTRRMMAAYLKRMPNAREIRSRIMACEDYALLEQMMHEYLFEIDSGLMDRSFDDAGRPQEAFRFRSSGASGL
jgi:tRNA-dihydrouridine synthase